jgi:hypothetical protein
MAGLGLKRFGENPSAKTRGENPSAWAKTRQPELRDFSLPPVR